MCSCIWFCAIITKNRILSSFLSSDNTMWFLTVQQSISLFIVPSPESLLGSHISLRGQGSLGMRAACPGGNCLPDPLLLPNKDTSSFSEAGTRKRSGIGCSSQVHLALYSNGWVSVKMRSWAIQMTAQSVGEGESPVCMQNACGCLVELGLMSLFASGSGFKSGQQRRHWEWMCSTQDPRWPPCFHSLSGFIEENRVKTTQEKVKTSLMCSVPNQTLVVGSRQGWAAVSLGPCPVQPHSAWSVVLVGSWGGWERFCLAVLGCCWWLSYCLRNSQRWQAGLWKNCSVENQLKTFKDGPIPHGFFFMGGLMSLTGGTNT